MEPAWYWTPGWKSRFVSAGGWGTCCRWRAGRAVSKKKNPLLCVAFPGLRRAGVRLAQALRPELDVDGESTVGGHWDSTLEAHFYPLRLASRRLSSLHW